MSAGRFRELGARLKSLFRGKRLDREMREEIEFHLENAVEAGVRSGLSREEALRRARIQLGHESAVLESVRDQRGIGWLASTVADLRRAGAGFRRHPGFFAITTAALALAVALNTLIFTVVDGVLVRPLPYTDGERLVRVFESTPENPKVPLSIANFLELRRRSQTLSSIALYTEEDLQLMHGEQPERMRAVRVSPGFFGTLGIAPMLGREFAESDAYGTARVVILSYRLWQREFQSDPGIVGKVIRLNRESWSVAGVLPAGVQHVGGAYRSPMHGDTVDLWWPLQLDIHESRQQTWHLTNAVAQLEPGVSIEQAQQELDSLATGLRADFPRANAELELRASPLRSEILGQSPDTVFLLMLGGGLVLLITCSNVAGLCLSRSLARGKEFAVCRALGAGSIRLMRAALCENLVIGAAGGAIGLLLGVAVFPTWQATLPTDFPRVQEVVFSYRAALFAFTVGVLASVVAGLAPAMWQSRADPASSINRESRSASSARGTNRLRSILVAGQFAFATVLCVLAGLLVHSSYRLSARSHGFHPEGVLTFTLALPETGYPGGVELNGFYARALARWRRLPGVQAAALAGNVPWTGHDDSTTFGIPGIQEETAIGPLARIQMASEGYFEALRIPLRAGRVFSERDDADSPLVVVINQRLADRFLEGRNPVGMTLEIWGLEREVIGVVGDIFDHPADLAPTPAFWLPLSQNPLRQVVATIHVDGDPLAALPGTVDAVREIDRELPVAEAMSMEDIARMALGERNLADWLFRTFAALAFAMALFGMYGLRSYIVEQRHKEFGIRMAMGATSRDVAWSVVRDGFVQAVVGGVVGVVLAPIAARSLASLLFGITTLDPAPLVSAPALILIGSSAANLAPAMRAARGEPGSRLRLD